MSSNGDDVIVGLTWCRCLVMWPHMSCDWLSEAAVSSWYVKSCLGLVTWLFNLPFFSILF